MIDYMKSELWKPIAITLLVLFGVQTYRLQQSNLATAKVTTTLAQERTTAATKLVQAQAKVLETEHSLQQSADEARKISNESITVLTAQRDALTIRLRNAIAKANTGRVPQAAAIASNAEGVSGSTGSELLGSFGEEDVLEAHRADTLRTHLVACYSQYDAARSELNK